MTSDCLFLPVFAWCALKIVLFSSAEQFYEHIMQELVKTEINIQSDVKFWLNWIKFGAVSYLLSCIQHQFQHSMTCPNDISSGLWSGLFVWAYKLLDVIQYYTQVTASCSRKKIICHNFLISYQFHVEFSFSVWGNLWWFSRDVYSIWLCNTIFICLSVGWIVCFTQ